MRLVGLGILDSSHCSVHATSLHNRVLFKHVCELGWMSSWEIWWQVLTSIIRAGCNTGRSHGYLKLLFGFRSWYDWRATTGLRTGGRQLWCWKLFSTLKLCLLTKVLTNFTPHSLQAPYPCPCSIQLWTKDKDKSQNEKKCKEAEGQKFKEGRENQIIKNDSGKECSDFKI